MIDSVTVLAYGYGKLCLKLPEDTRLELTLTEPEAHELLAVAEAIYERRQAAIAADIARPLPRLVEGVTHD